MGSLSIWHWIVVIAVVLLLFGRGKISELMGDVAQGIKAFKKGMSEDALFSRVVGAGGLFHPPTSSGLAFSRRPRGPPPRRRPSRPRPSTISPRPRPSRRPRRTRPADDRPGSASERAVSCVRGVGQPVCAPRS